jgi:hypothetical protein
MPLTRRSRVRRRIGNNRRRHTPTLARRHDAGESSLKRPLANTQQPPPARASRDPLARSQAAEMWIASARSMRPSVKTALAAAGVPVRHGELAA